MADYSGTHTDNHTLVNGDTIGSSSDLTVGSPGVFTVTAGATISFYATRSCSITTGTFNATGTFASPIIFNAQAADPTLISYAGLSFSGVGSLTLQYVKILNATNPVLIGNNPTATLNINKLWWEGGQAGFKTVSALTDATWNIQNIYGRKTIGNNYTISWGCTGVNTIQFNNVWIEDMGTSAYFAKCTINKIVTRYMGAGALYLANPGFTITGAYLQAVSSVVNNGDTTGITTLTSAVVQLFGAGSNTSGLQMSTAGGTFNSSYNDIIDCLLNGIRQSAGTMNSDYDYIAGCNGRPSGLADVGAGTQVTGTITRTNMQSAPNMPLTVDNISEGAPGQTSITITFDCAAGTTTKRSYGLPFIRYGTVSGTYPMSSYIPPSDLYGLYWIGWYTDVVWGQTGHSVTLTGLNPGSTYYYQCCYFDPFGRLAVSAEGEFTTSPAAGVYPAEPDVRVGEDYGPTGTEYVGEMLPAVDPAAPTFAGIAQLEAVGGGCLRATWSAGTGTITGYKIYCRQGSAPTFVDETYLKMKVDVNTTEAIFRTGEDNTTFMESTAIWYVAVRAEDDGAIAQDDVNAVVLSVTPTGAGTYVTVNDRKIGLVI